MHTEINRREKIMAHDEKELCKLGDKVSIIPAGRRLSKNKTFVVEKILKPAGSMEDFK